MFRIGKLSEITGISIKTIRFYEEKGLLSPIEVDRWTNYRYYDESSIDRLSQIAYLKNLGLTLNEILNLNEETLKKKTKELTKILDKIKSNINTLSDLSLKGEIVMKNFVDDPRVIGKWKKIAVVDSVDDFRAGKRKDFDVFIFNNLYFLPKGEQYWIFSWSKGKLFVKDKVFKYDIIDGKLFIYLTVYGSKEISDIIVYEQLDDKKYTREEIRIEDNIDLPFIDDRRLLGVWNVADLIDSKKDFKPADATDKYYVKRIIFDKAGRVDMIVGDDNRVLKMKWTKNVLINEKGKTASEIEIIDVKDDEYMILEWKSGDYVFGGEISCYYVLKKIK